MDVINANFVWPYAQKLAKMIRQVYTPQAFQEVRIAASFINEADKGLEKQLYIAPRFFFNEANDRDDFEKVLAKIEQDPSVKAFLKDTNYPANYSFRDLDFQDVLISLADTIFASLSKSGSTTEVQDLFKTRPMDTKEMKKFLATGSVPEFISKAALTGGDPELKSTLQVYHYIVQSLRNSDFKALSSLPDKTRNLTA